MDAQSLADVPASADYLQRVAALVFHAGLWEGWNLGHEALLDTMRAKVKREFELPTVDAAERKLEGYTPLPPEWLPVSEMHLKLFELAFDHALHGFFEAARAYANRTMFKITAVDFDFEQAMRVQRVITFGGPDLFAQALKQIQAPAALPA